MGDVDALKDLARRVEVDVTLRKVCETESFGSEDGTALEPTTDEEADRRVRAFIHDNDMGEDGLALIRVLPQTLQLEVVEQFDVQGTRDGNMKSRFMSFIRGIWLRYWQVNHETGDSFRDLPPDLQVDVMKTFNPAGTKDGNVSARLQNFATKRWHITRKSKKRELNLEKFMRDWNLEPWAWEVLHALPPDLCLEVFIGFDASSTRDGNVSGRFLGYVRSKWLKHFGLDEDLCHTIKRLPQEGQLMCLTQFDPASTRDGNISGRMRGFLRKVDAKLADAERRKYRGHGGYGSYGYDQSYQSHNAYSSWDYYGDYSDYSYSARDQGSGMRDGIIKFVSRWNLDLAVGAYLETLQDPDVVARVLEEFDPGSAQDGNVLGRLKDFVRLLKHGKADDFEAPRRKEKLKEWQKKPWS